MVNLKNKKRIWDEVKCTDPRFTKKVSKGAYGFTAVDAHYNVLKATEIFGAHGDGWGWDIIEHSVIDGVFMVIVQLWYSEEMGLGPEGEVMVARRTCSPVFGTCKFKGTNKRGDFIDEEAPKKALTDALSKAWSYLGFSADVFLGFFDNHKYVQSMTQRFSKEKASE